MTGAWEVSGKALAAGNADDPTPVARALPLTDLSNGAKSVVQESGLWKKPGF